MKTSKFFLIVLFFSILIQNNKIQAFQAVQDDQRVRASNCFKFLIFYSIATTSFLASASNAFDAYHGNNNKIIGPILYTGAGAICLIGWAYIKNLIGEPRNR